MSIHSTTRTVTVTTDGQTVILTAPYDPTLPPLVRGIGGRWNAADKTWTFDARDEQRVRDLSRQVYGTDGQASLDSPTVTVRIEVPGTYGIAEWRVAGRLIVRREHRDSPVAFGADVVLVTGGWPGNGGSMRSPRLGDAKPGTVVEVRDVPVDVAQRMCDTQVGAGIVDGADAQRAALEAERTRLVARLAEIDAQMGEL